MTISYPALGKFDHQAADLERIERHARNAMNSAISLTGAVRLLRTQPQLETVAFHQMQTAEAELELTLDAVRKAMTEFNTKPVS